MLSIGAVAKMACISSRTLRHYESIGLIKADLRGENNYRYYSKLVVERIQRIRDLQSLGFSLDEISVILALGPEQITENLERKLCEVEQGLKDLDGRRERLMKLLSVSKRVQNLDEIKQKERKFYMDMLKEEIINGIKARRGVVTGSHYEYISREEALCDNLKNREFLAAVKKCFRFAEDHHFTLGPGRGSSLGSLSLFALGLTALDPTDYDLLPERVFSREPVLHIDVEYQRGQAFVDYCQTLSNSLTWGKIVAFRMPIIDIIQNVQRRLGQSVAFSSFDNDSSNVMDLIRVGEIEKIFGLDNSERALVMKFAGWLPGYTGTSKIRDYILSQNIQNFRDVLNIYSLWQPTHQTRLDRLETYRQSKLGVTCYPFLGRDIQDILKESYGMILYHEDLVRVMSKASGWSFERCNDLRIALLRGQASADVELFNSLVSDDTRRLVEVEAKLTFCKAHTLSFGQIMRQTVILKSLNKQLYLDEVARWEETHGLAYDDIGIKIQGASLLL